ncbi:hypothetical protein [Paenibacillus amylolyticus]|uniref:Uncharacterized protein n=1 Tax=Paenibacillus amylolyticus TaxID=1451 RepID=A0ABD8AYU4_PAEAM
MNNYGQLLIKERAMRNGELMSMTTSKKSNLFNLNDLYRRLPKKPFIKGRKQELEIMMMYDWLHGIEGDEEYWEEYKSKVIENS